ncbi:MAG: uroporphyrinogen-III C-methyltransferase [Gammaproteobacteria bacterium]
MSDNKQPSASSKTSQQNQPNNKPAEITAPKSSSGSGGRFFIGLVSLLALLLSGAGIAAGYKAWLELSKRIDQATVDRQSIAHEVATIDESTKLQNFKAEIENNISSIKQSVSELSNQVENQAAAQKDIELAAQETLQHVNRSQLGWGLKEIEHVLRMANHRLRIERDIQGTITALKAASSRLHELNDPRLLPVRESVSKQVGKLKNFPYPDWVGISLQLDNILAGLKQTIIKNAKQRQEKNSEETNTDDNEKELSGWGKLIDGVKSSINDSIKITREEQQLKIFISEQESQHAYEFLRTKLLGAKYAVASRDDDAYHQELEAALAWLKSTDTLENKRDVIEDLSELNNINLEPALPDITEANTLLNEIMETINNN